MSPCDEKSDKSWIIEVQKTGQDLNEDARFKTAGHPSVADVGDAHLQPQFCMPCTTELGTSLSSRNDCRRP